MNFQIILAISIALVAWLVMASRRARLLPWLGVQLIAALITECICSFWAEHGWNNQWIYNLYFAVEFGALLLLAAALAAETRLRRAVFALVLLYPVAQVLESSAEDEPYLRFASITYASGALLLCVAYAALLFRLAATSLVPLPARPELWLMLSMVLWFGGSIPFNGLLNYLSERDRTLALELYVINDILGSLRYALVAIACVIWARRPALA